MRLTQALAAEYQNLFASCTLKPPYRAVVARLTAQLLKHQQRYAIVEQASTVPWAVIAVIHALESGLRFDRHLHNGDPLHCRTVNVPAGRPLSMPPFTWETSAIDALHYSGLSQWRNWSIAGTLFKLEAYNGWGYRRYHPQVLSPYLWSFSEHYQRGKYAADGRFDAHLVSQQCGAAVLLKELLSHITAPALGLRLNNNANQGSTTKEPSHPQYPGQLLRRSRKPHCCVKYIQLRLNALGYQPALAVDNYFGAKTEQAVKWFQTNSPLTNPALKVDGIVGPKTWQALFNTD